MKLFLKSKKLWCYISEDSPKPIHIKNEFVIDYTARLDDWESIHNKIL